MATFPPPLVRTVATFDLFGDCFRQARHDIYQSLVHKDYERFVEVLASYSRTDAERDLFIKSGSFYMPIASLMKKGKFEAVIDGIAEAQNFEQFITPKIRECQRLCLSILQRKADGRSGRT